MTAANSNDVSKLGFVSQNMRHFPIPKSLSRAALWYQPPKSDPKPSTVSRGIEWVEIVTKGRGWVEIEGQWVEVTRGALLWHVEGDRTIARSDWDNPYHCLVFEFQTGRFRGQRRAARLTWWNNAEEVECFGGETLRAFMSEETDRDALFLYVYGRLLFQTSQWQCSAHRKSELPAKLSLAVELWERNPLISIRQLARKIEWSAPHMHEMFVNHLNATPHQFVLRLRMHKAREKLMLTNAPIKQIASECGFSYASSFCKTFKAQIGMTPLEYRGQEGQIRS